MNYVENTETLKALVAGLGDPVSYVEPSLVDSFLAASLPEVEYRCQIPGGEIVLLRSHLVMRVRTRSGWPLGVDIWLPSHKTIQAMRAALSERLGTGSN